MSQSRAYIRGPQQGLENPQCRRCGYDLRGITQTWNDKGACPLTGKCSECGLDFDWHLIFGDSKHPWLFESTHRYDCIRRFVYTILMTYRPWRFWKEIAMTDRINLSRLIRIPAILLITLFLLRLVEVCWAYQINNGFTFPKNLGNLWQSVSWFLTDWYENGYGAWYDQVPREFNFAIGTPFFWTTFMILSFSLLPVSRRRARVSYPNLVRVGVYTLVPIIPYLFIWAMIDLSFVGWHAFLTSSSPPGLRFIGMFGLRLIPSLGWFGWQIICWSFACKRYLKLPHAFLIALLLTILSGLVESLLALVLIA